MTRALAHRSLLVLLAALPAACDVTAPCLVESRAAQYEATTAGATAALELAETRGSGNGAFVVWHVRVTPPSAPARAVVLRDAAGRLLYDFPLVNAVPDAGVVTQVFVRTPYAGAIPFAEIQELAARQQSFVEVTRDGAATLRIGPLARTAGSDWQEACS